MHKAIVSSGGMYCSCFPHLQQFGRKITKTDVFVDGTSYKKLYQQFEKNLSYKVGNTSFSLISNRLALLGKWPTAVTASLPLPFFASVFHDFAQYTQSKELARYANPILLIWYFVFMWCWYMQAPYEKCHILLLVLTISPNSESSMPAIPKICSISDEN